MTKNDLQVVFMQPEHIPFLHSLFQDTVNRAALHAREFSLVEWQEAFAAAQNCYCKAGYQITDSGECHGSDGVMRRGSAFTKALL